MSGSCACNGLPARRRGIGTRSIVVTAVLVLLLLSILVATGLTGSIFNLESPKTETSSPVGATSTSASSSVSVHPSSASSISSPSSLAVSTSSIPTCSGDLFHPHIGEKLNISLGQTLHVCVEFYYYSGPAHPGPMAVNLTDQIAISNKIRDASSNFTRSFITGNNASGTIQIGGPSNENEGYLAMYSITPKVFPGVPYGGTYTMDFLANLAPQFLSYGNSPYTIVTSINGTATNVAIGVMGCAYEFYLVFGSGLPDYESVGHCTVVSAGTVPSGQLYPPEVLVAAIIGMTIS